MEYKAAPAFTMGINGRTVTGIGAVHGNVDDGGDRSYPGVFGDFTVAGRSRARFLWQHDSSQPPIAKIERQFEVARADLPEAVLKYAPNATGGTAIERTYLDTPRGNEVLIGLVNDAITEMSYAYDVRDAKPAEFNGQPIREIFKADVYDWSDVNWGLNPATSADGVKRAQPIDVQHATVLAAVADYTRRYAQLSELRAKEGRVLSGDNRKRIESAIEALDGATKALGDLLAATEPKSYAETHALRARWAAQQQRLRELGVM